MSHSHGGPSNSRTRNPFQASPSPFAWDSPSAGSDFNSDFNFDDESLRLPPINHTPYFRDDDNNFNLPSLDDSQFFDALPQAQAQPQPHHPPAQLASPSALFPSPPNDTISRHLPPPPSNQQQASRQLPLSSPQPQHSHYTYASSDSPDPFSDLIFPPSPPADRSRSRTPARGTIVVDLTDSPPQMPPAKKRKAEELGESSGPKLKREPTRRSARTPAPRSSQDIVEVVDLEKVEGKKEYEDFQAKQQAEAIKKQNLDESNKPVKLAEFQCIICMDNPTDLTVTHCGHLFCSECLHSALNAGDKRSCPVCRSIINMAKPGSKPTKNGAFALEMKLMTANKKGKQPASH